MKKVITVFGAILFASTILTSCGGGEKSDKNATTENENADSKNETIKKEDASFGKVNYSDFKIGNKDKTFFKMVDGGSAEIKLGELNMINVTAEFEVVKKFTGKLGQYQTEQAFVSLIALDKDGNTIKLSTTSNGEMRPEGDGEGKQFADFLRGEPGYKSKFVFTGCISKEGTFDADIEKTKEAAKKIAGFKVLTNK